jgi:HTH-type transcriptional regulator/antitoxin HigA
MEKMNVVNEDLQSHWTAVEPLLVIRSKQDYELAVARLNHLLDQVGTDEQHPLYGLLDTLGVLIHAHEQQHIAMPRAAGRDVLSYLMEEHSLTQSDLPEVGSQGVVSEILHGKRQLNVRQIRALADRFGVSPAVFL